jgi:two-component system sensor histidine kinase KdpD
MVDEFTSLPAQSTEISPKTLLPQKPRGQLKVFLGYAAGVGKSYSMLEAANQRLTEGVDVVIGVIETHRFTETKAFIRNLEIIPLQKIISNYEIFYEMDIDAILKRKPQLVLIDELAHTNYPDSRHPKRYQDVVELLDAGINVYTTLNIQHLENLSDVIHQITGVYVDETIPNHILDSADEIEVIDLPADELRKRIQDGKVHFPEQTSYMMEQFFRKGNLTALREIALRYAADRVDTQMLEYMEKKSINGPWPVREKILVAISAHPLGERLVRTAHRLALSLNVEWMAVYIETQEHLSYTTERSDQVAHTLKLAEDLGAKVVRIADTSIPESILTYAKKHNFTKIIVGKSPDSGRLKRFHKTILGKLIQNCGSIDIHIVSGDEGYEEKNKPFYHLRILSYRPYFLSLLIVALTTVIALFFRSWLDPVNLVMPYLAVVVVCAYYYGRGPSMLASLLGILAFDFFFIAPHLTLTVADSQYLLTFAGLLAIGLIISNLTARVRDQMDAIQRKNIQTQTLLSLSRDLTTAIGLEAILETIIDHICQTIAREAVIFLPRDGILEISGKSKGFQLDEQKTRIASLAFENNKPTGNGTDTYTSSSYRFQPMRTRQGILGVLGVDLVQLSSYHKSEQLQLFDAYTSLAAMSIERSLLDEWAKENQVLKESERLKTALLNSISHDLRTPLATITGALDSLKEAEQDKQNIVLDQIAKLDLIQTASEEAQRLNLLVQNLLDMTRLESGAVRLHLGETDLRDLISTALSHTQDLFQNRQIVVNIPDDLPGVMLDFIMMEQVLINIFDNAIKFSDPGTVIEITVTLQFGSVEILISDQGIGIPPEALELVFDKFYQADNTNQTSGTGLGLSICRGIVEAHCGKIVAENREGGGTIIKILLPLQAAESERPL